MKLYATDAHFLGTASKTVVTKPDEVRKYFENALLNNQPKERHLLSMKSMILSDTAVVIFGLDTVTGVRDGTPFSNSGRATFVVAKRGADWQILHFHRSAMPR